MHTGPLRALVVDKKGKYAYTGGYDKRIYKWDLQSNDSKLLTRHNHLVCSLSLSNNGKYLLTGSSDYSMRLIDTETNLILKTYLGHTDDIEFAIFTSDDKYIISTSLQHDGRVLVWEVGTGSIILEFKGHTSSVKSAWTIDDKVFSSDNDGNVLVWNFKTGELLDNLGPYDCDIDTINGDKNRNLLLAGLDSGDIDVYDTISHEKIKTLKGHEIGVKTIEFSPSGDYILTAAYDHQILIWDRNFSLISSLPQYRHQWEVAFAFTPDEKYVLGCTFGYKFCKWDFAKNELIQEEEVVCATPSINDLAVSKNGDVATASDDGVFRFNGENLLSVNHVLNNAVGISHNGDFIAWGDHKGLLHLYDNVKKVLINTLDFSSGPLNSIVYDSKNHSFFIGSYGGYVSEFNLNSMNITNRFKAHNGAIKGMVVEADFIATGSSGGQVFIFDRHDLSKVPISLIGSSFVINDVTYDKESNTLATVSRDRLVRVYDATTGGLKGINNLHKYSVKTASFNNSGILFAGDYWGNVSIWDLHTQDKKIVKVSSNGISFMEQFNDYVIAASYDGGVYIIGNDGKFKELFRLFDQSKENELIS